MKKLLIILPFICTLAIAAPSANNGTNDENSEGQPKVILVKSSSPKKLTHTPQHKKHAKKHAKKSKQGHKHKQH